jgi:hypothetical protein
VFMRYDGVMALLYLSAIVLQRRLFDVTYLIAESFVLSGLILAFVFVPPPALKVLYKVICTEVKKTFN